MKIKITISFSCNFVLLDPKEFKKILKDKKLILSNLILNLRMKMMQNITMKMKKRKRMMKNKRKMKKIKRRKKKFKNSLKNLKINFTKQMSKIRQLTSKKQKKFSLVMHDFLKIIN